MDNFIQYALIAFAVSASMYFLRKGAARAVAQDANGVYTLRMQKAYLYLGYGTIVLCIGLMIFPFVMPGMEEGAWIIVWAIGLFFAALGMPCILYYKNHIVAFDQEVIEVKNIFGTKRQLNWADVVSIKTNAFTGFIVLKNHNGEKIRVHQHMAGLNAFIHMMEKQTRWKESDLKLR